MTTHTVSPAQAQHLAGLLSAAEQAAERAQHAVALLTLGHVPAGATLADINTDTGVLTFTVAGSADDTRQNVPRETLDPAEVAGLLTGGDGDE